MKRSAAFDTPLGHGGLLWGPGGLLRVLLRHTSEAEVVSALRAYGGEPAARLSAGERGVVTRVVRHLGGAPQRFDDVALDLTGASPFQRRVYDALRATTPGQTVSYGELAARAGAPGAARAVGGAMADNPWPLIVPCHRVLGAGRRLGRFSAPGGSFTKAKLLTLEGATFDGAPGLAGELPFDATDAMLALRAVDAQLGQVMDRVGPLRLRPRGSPSTFVALARAIVFQQLSGKAAGTIFGRLEALARGRGLQPADVLAASDTTLRGVGLSGGKAAALRDLARRVEEGSVPSLGALGAMPEPAAFDALLPIRGVGSWSVQMLLMFELGKPDVLAPADLGLRKGYARAFGGPLPSPDELEQHGQRWRPYRTVASWYLWRVLELP